MVSYVLTYIELHDCVVKIGNANFSIKTHFLLGQILRLKMKEF